MGCSASSLEEGGGDYPGAGREEREARLEWEGGGDMSVAEEVADDREPIVAKPASETVLRKLREKEWGVAVCDAYYTYLNAVEAELDDDWNGHRRDNQTDGKDAADWPD